MRILNLKLKNLNSLVGEWEIDFTDNSFAIEGLFAITGPTGAGKTTILDAICLALYGKTPRLDRVNKSTNDIMSRHKYDCYAELLFQTKRGKYLCHWSQQRARKKADGQLQNHKHEISDADSGKLLETHIRKVLEKVEDVTGMDFERFTRSMLLAQGGFAAFLQATSDERAPILEHITGTEIYSLISQKVHDRRSKEKKKLDDVNAKLEGISPLSKEEEDVLCGHYTENKKEIDSLNKDLDEKNDIINDLNTHKLEITKLHELKKLLPSLEGKVKGFKEKKDFLVKDLHQKQAFQKSQIVVIRKVRALDEQIHRDGLLIQELCKSLSCVEVSLEELLGKKRNNDRDLLDAHTQLQSLKCLFEECPQDSKLIEDLPRIEARFDNFRMMSEKNSEISISIEAAKKDLKCSEFNVAESQSDLEVLKTKLHKQQKDQQSLEEELQQKLHGKNLDELRDRFYMLKEQKNFLHEALILVSDISGLKALLQDLDAREENLSKSIVEKQKDLDCEERDLVHLERELLMANRIKDLEEARCALEEDKPCPLCGALEHPYSREGIPSFADTERSIAKKRAIIREVRDTLFNMKSSKAEISKEREIKSNIYHKTKESLQGLYDRSPDDSPFKQLGLSNGDGYLLQMRALLEDVDSSCTLTKGLLEEISSIEEKAKKKYLEYQKFEKDVNALNEKCSGLIHAKDKIADNLIHHHREQEDVQKHLERYRKELAELLKIYGIEELSLDGLTESLNLLKTRCQNWQEAKRQEIECSKIIDRCKNLDVHLVEQISKLESDVERKREALLESNKKLGDLHEERKYRFQDKKTDDEENKLSLDIEKALEDFEKIREESEAGDKELFNTKEQMKALSVSIEVRSKLLKDYFEIEKDNKCFSDREGNALELFSLDLVFIEEVINFIRGKFKALKVTLGDLQSNLGAINQQLENNKILHLKMKTYLENMDFQRKEYERWDALHVLIGSADGKKYRNFAQGLTFEMMIAHANEHLRKMTDRYLLVRDIDKPLELNVVDNKKHYA